MKWVVSVGVLVAMVLVGMGPVAMVSARMDPIQKIGPGFTPGTKVPFALQHTPGGQNWQGALIKIHLFDATEIVGGTVTMTVSGTGTAVVALTGLATSVSHFISLSNFVASGINPTNVNVNVVASLEPGGTQVGQTSDLDFSLMLFDIRHRTFSETVVFLPSAVIRVGQSPWMHITDTTTLVRQASDRRAFNVGNILVGVDHARVPEPLSTGILSAGLLLGVIGYSIRRKRLGSG